MNEIRPASGRGIVHLGAHMSIAGGFDQAAERARRVGATALQVFVKSSNQWRSRALAAGESEQFAEACRRAGVQRVVAHDSYLINLCSGNPALWRRSVDAMADEIERCDALGIPALVAHPGAHVGEGEVTGIERLVLALDLLADKQPRAGVRVLLETTAGQGTTLGHRFEHLAVVLHRVRRPERLGVCLDTCHIFAAGYDIRTPATYERTLAEFDRVVGLAQLGVIHLNDSKKGLGSRVDRHEHIGRGCLGLDAFRCLLNDPRLQHLPMVLETPKGEDLREDAENLERLRGLLGSPASLGSRRTPLTTGAEAGGGTATATARESRGAVARGDRARTGTAAGAVGKRARRSPRPRTGKVEARRRPARPA